MKRQSLELATCVSFVTYAAIVLAGQAVHWIPGFGCCHSHWGSSRGVVNDLLVTGINVPVTRYLDAGTQSHPRTGSPTDRDATIATHRSCPICHWFSMAQWQSLPVQFAGEVVFLGPIRLPTCELRNLSFGGILPRGPPLVFAAARNS